MKLKVNGEKIDPKEIEQEIERLRPQYEEYARNNNTEPDDKQLREWSRENIIERTLLKQKAADAGIDVEQLIEEVTSEVEKPTEEDARKFYDKNTEMFIVPEQIRAAHIVKYVNDPSEKTNAYLEICNIQEELNHGKSFEELASANSDCSDAGGDLGYFCRGQMVQEFEDVAFSMETGEISDVFLTPFGYHIVKLNEKRPAGPVPFEEVKDSISEQLTAERNNKALESYLDRLKTEAVIS